MAASIHHAPESNLAILSPPYEQFVGINHDWEPGHRPPRGAAIVWWLVDGVSQECDFYWLSRRPHGVPLFVVLPHPSKLQQAMPILAYVNALAPRAILPIGPLISPHNITSMLRLPPGQLHSAVVSYLGRRDLLRSAEMRSQVLRIFSAASEVSSVTGLARKLATSRRTLGRHFEVLGLPVPSHWLQFARLLRAVTYMHMDSDITVHRAATRAGYPDGFTMSNQMKRLLDCRPSEIRGCFGWEWVVEQWIRCEVRSGGIDPIRYPSVASTYLSS